MSDLLVDKHYALKQLLNDHPVAWPSSPSHLDHPDETVERRFLHTLGNFCLQPATFARMVSRKVPNLDAYCATLLTSVGKKREDFALFKTAIGDTVLADSTKQEMCALLDAVESQTNKLEGLAKQLGYETEHQR